MCEIITGLIIFGIIMALFHKKKPPVAAGDDYGMEELREEFPDDFNEDDE